MLNITNMFLIFFRYLLLRKPTCPLNIFQNLKRKGSSPNQLFSGAMVHKKSQDPCDWYITPIHEWLFLGVGRCGKYPP